MRLPFFENTVRKKPDEMTAVDLGSRTTKAVHLQRQGEGFTLCGYALLDAPIFEKSLSVELLAEHLRAVAHALELKTRHVTLAVRVDDAQVRHADIPPIPIEDMRMVLKLNPKNYLQQDLPGHVFDCHVNARPHQAKSANKAKTLEGIPKQRVLVAGARQQIVNDLVQGAKAAGLAPQCITPGVIGPVNTFERAMPEVFAKEAVALVDIGFKNSSICIVRDGELMLSRVVGIGGDRLTNGLAETLNVSYAEAEGIKVGMPAEVQVPLEALLLPLGRELRASMDFFEHQHDCPVSQVFLTGGSSRSDFIVQRLKPELMVDCKILSPLPFLQLQLRPKQMSEIEEVATQLSVAVGAALAAL